MSYKVSTSGFDQTLVSLTDIDPQPRSDGLKPTKRTFGFSGSINEQGKYIELEYTVIGDESDYLALLQQFDLDTFDTKEVTIYIPNENYVMTRYNGIAVKPEIGKDVIRKSFFVRDVTMLIKHLEVAA